jgi:hypothetical protein
MPQPVFNLTIEKLLEAFDTAKDLHGELSINNVTTQLAIALALCERIQQLDETLQTLTTTFSTKMDELIAALPGMNP